MSFKIVKSNRARGQAVGDAGLRAARSGGFVGKLIPIIVLLAILWVLYKFVLPMIMGGADSAVDAAKETGANVAETVTDAAGDAADAAKGAVDSAAETVSETAEKAADVASDAADTVTDTAKAAADTAADTAQAAVDTASDAASTVADNAADAASGMVPDVGEFSTELGGLFDGATNTLSSITDADTATAAVPQLTELGAKLDDMGSLFDAIPEAARGPIQSLVGDKMGGLTSQIETITALPGVGEIIKPVVDGLMSKLSMFSG